METKRLPILVSLLLAFSLLLPGGGADSSRTDNRPTGQALFIENAGQFDSAARFQVWGSPLGAGTTWLAEDAIWLSQVISPQSEDLNFDEPILQVINIKLAFLGSNPGVRIEPFNRLDNVISYFIGNDLAQWRPAVPVWGGVRYVDLYPGVNLTLGGSVDPWQLEAAPGAAIEQVRMQIEGADVIALEGAALKLEVGNERLSIVLPSAALAYRAIIVSQEGAPLSLTVQPGLRSDSKAYPADDPRDLLYGTFMGGSNGYDHGSDIAVDGEGNAYVTGFTNASDFPTAPGAFDLSYNGGEDAFVAKLDPTSATLVYATFLGGSNLYMQEEEGLAIAVDEMGSAYVTGFTGSADFPTTPGALDTSFEGVQNGFVTKLNATGSALVYSTFLGSSSSSSFSRSQGRALAVDGTGSAFVAGYTESTAFPTTPGAFDVNLNGPRDAFVVKLNPTGSSLAYGTFLGGDDDDSGNAIAVDGTGSAYVTGSTLSGNFPVTLGAFDTNLNGSRDAFVTKLNPTGTALTYSTYLGGSSLEEGLALAVDGTGSAYLTGYTFSADFSTTPDAYDTSFKGGPGDVFVVKLNPTGGALGYATFLAGSGYETGRGIAVDRKGYAYVAGYTYSNDFPISPGAFDTTHNGGNDAFVTLLSSAGNALLYATYLGGGNNEGGSAIARDQAGDAYVTGGSNSGDFPTTTGAYDTTLNGSESDAYVAKLRVVVTYSHFVWLPIVMKNY